MVDIKCQWNGRNESPYVVSTNSLININEWNRQE